MLEKCEHSKAGPGVSTAEDGWKIMGNSNTQKRYTESDVQKRLWKTQEYLDILGYHRESRKMPRN